MLKACACAGEQRSRGAGEQGSRGAEESYCTSSFPSAPLPLCPFPQACEKCGLRNPGAARRVRSPRYTSKPRPLLERFCHRIKSLLRLNRRWR
ncbi:hypothetical protein FM036_18710 [Nostoc sp. HG1]|nr:hypothetical protein [Nostoc sp. HG1]